jgi:hypothetical protein
MASCRSCGYQLAGSGRYCTVCGAAWADGGATAIPDSIWAAADAEVHRGPASAAAAGGMDSVDMEPEGSALVGDHLAEVLRRATPRDPYGYLYATPRDQAATSLLCVPPGAADPAAEQAEWATARPRRAAGRTVPPPGRDRILVAAASGVLALAAAGAIVTVLHFRANDAVSAGPLAGTYQAHRARHHRHSPASSPSSQAPTPAPTPALPPDPAPAPPPAVGNSLVAVAPGAAGEPHAEAAVALLTGYFTAINRHDYLSYRSLFTPRLQVSLTPATFLAGFRTTADSAATLDEAFAAGTGRLAATVTFTSHQNPADSPDHAACTTWRITLYLAPRAGRYLIDSPPAGYRASYQRCR